MAAYLSPIFGAGAQLFNNQGIVLSGGKIWTYQAGTTTPLATWTDSTQVVTNANPIILDSAGRPSNEMWLQGSSTYKLILTDSNNNVLGTWDNIAGLNDITSVVTVSEWSLTGFTPSYISATSFSVPGNNAASFAINRRVKIVVSAGTVYGYVVSSVFSSVTTVVIQPDSTVLDAGISSVSIGLPNSVNVSIPQQYLAMNAPITVASSATTPIGAAMSANVIVSGVVTITAFDNVLAGIIKLVKFTGALTLTHNGTSLILPGAINITTGAGDQAIFRSLGLGNWECVTYQINAISPDNAGDVKTTFALTAPPGWYLIPKTAQAPVSRTGVYASINTIMSSLSYPFGAGDGSTTFVMPWIAAGYTWVQAVSAATAGALTHGKVKDHVHTLGGSFQIEGAATAVSTFVQTASTNTSNPVAPEGGADNLAAGIGINYILKL